MRPSHTEVAVLVDPNYARRRELHASARRRITVTGGVAIWGEDNPREIVGHGGVDERRGGGGGRRESEVYLNESGVVCSCYCKNNQLCAALSKEESGVVDAD